MLISIYSITAKHFNIYARTYYSVFKGFKPSRLSSRVNPRLEPFYALRSVYMHVFGGIYTYPLYVLHVPPSK